MKLRILTGSRQVWIKKLDTRNHTYTYEIARRYKDGRISLVGYAMSLRPSTWLKDYYIKITLISSHVNIPISIQRYIDRAHAQGKVISTQKRGR